MLADVRGADGFPPVWQANTIMAAPDFERMHAPLFECGSVPLIEGPLAPSRWERPGAWAETERVIEDGLWWAELHGLHHIPETAWLEALRRGADDARRAHEQQTAVCAAVEASGEHDPREPAADRTRRLEHAVRLFTARFGRAPTSFCPPDYRFDPHTEADAVRLGIRVLQGKGEQAGVRLPRLRRWLLARGWPGDGSGRFVMPPRIAFEPYAPGGSPERTGATAVHRRARESWGRGQPAVVSTHRCNYARLDPNESALGRAALRELLRRLAADGAVFLTDSEVRQLVVQSWSQRPVGSRGAFVRYHGVPHEPFTFPAPAGTSRVSVREGRGPEDVHVALEGSEVRARLNVGEYLLEWK